MDRQKEKIKMVKEMYPKGTRIILLEMEGDEEGMHSGLRGTVTGVDDQPALLMNWDNGRGLSALYGIDSFRKLSDAEIAEEQNEEQNEVQSMDL